MTWTESGAPGNLGVRVEADELLGIFLRAISHDLKSPLLTLSLSAELLADMLPAGERAQIVRDGLTDGVREMERMLDAVTAVSRARTRILNAHPVPLGDVLSGQIVLSEDEHLGQTFVAADARCMAELLAAVAGDRAAEVRLELRGTHAHLALMLPEPLATITESPLRALLSSLQQYAGTALAPLAAAQVQLERQGGSLDCADGRLLVRLPLAEGAS
jgi:signal transduction histidine kinase